MMNLATLLGDSSGNKRPPGVSWDPRGPVLANVTALPHGRAAWQTRGYMDRETVLKNSMPLPEPTKPWTFEV